MTVHLYDLRGDVLLYFALFVVVVIVVVFLFLFFDFRFVVVVVCLFLLLLLLLLLLLFSCITRFVLETGEPNRECKD